jgi:glucosyl-dolichyl phosphate glucuronosyltransferase
MLISAVICTWNRADLLDRTLAEMRKLRIPNGVDWELLVVDNNSTDSTAAVIAGHEQHLPIRPMFEARQGKSHACNMAVVAARGELLLWTDDDVLVDPEWLSAYANAAERWPRAACFGGPVAPWYEFPPPAWIERHRGLLQGMLAVRDYGPEERPFSADEAPFGANMALRRHVFDDLQFDPQLGPNKDTGLIGEETTLLRTLRQRGCQGVVVPAAKVRHFIGAERMTPGYLWRWAYGWGRTTVRMERGDGATAPRHPLWRMRVNCWRHGMRYFRRRLLGRGDWVSPYYNYAATSGIIAEWTGSNGAR